MIHIITAENRSLFHHALTEMHSQRKHVFIDRMGWAIEEAAGLEIDQFDNAEGIYLIEIAENGAVLQSARLLRTDRPHLLSEVFGDLCIEGPPRSAAIWEASRFCPAPGTPKGAERRACLGRMIAAILETGILFGAEEVSFVAGAALAPLAENAGWSVRRLGPAKRVGRERVVAMAAAIDSAGLAAVRQRYGLAAAPITRFAYSALKRAA